MKLRTLLLVALLSVVGIWLAIANRHEILFNLDPFDAANPSLAWELPAFLLIAAVFFLGMLAGGMAMWVSQRRNRRLARDRGRELRRVERERAHLPVPTGDTSTMTTAGQKPA